MSRMRPLLAALTALCVLTIAGCDDGPSSMSSSRSGTIEEPRSTPQIVVTRTSDRRPANCGPRAAALLVLDYLRAFNDGSPRAVELFDFEAGPVPGWYSVTSGRGAPPAASVSAHDRDALGSYLASRHRQGERLRLTELRVAERDGLGQIEYRMTRQADDLASRKRLAVEGKGAIHCASSAIVAWSMSVVDRGETTGRLCPAPERAGDEQRPDVVACARV